jgi:hypothetical protein
LREVSSLTSEQVVQALRKQVSLLDSGESMTIGEILIRDGMVTREQLGRALTMQRKESGADPKVSRRESIFVPRRITLPSAPYEAQA